MRSISTSQTLCDNWALVLKSMITFPSQREPTMAKIWRDFLPFREGE